jgi:predicted phosphoribosyltransferase
MLDHAFEISQREDLRNQSRVFRDREHAGQVLAQMLTPALGNAEPSELQILTIPMGGVPVALPIRQRLGCALDLVIVRKLQIPGNPEAGFGAMTAQGDVFYNEPLLERLRLSRAQIEQTQRKVRRELAVRNERLRGNRAFPELQGKTVILVDDGLASGFTMRASLHQARQRGAARTVVAVPTAPQRSIDALAASASPPDAVYCANIRDAPSFAVAEAYQRWYDLTEPEVLEALRAAPGVKVLGW